jgi:hypothetical protein
MQAYHVNTTIQEDGTLTVSHLPLQAGEVVEVDHSGSTIQCAASGPLSTARHAHFLYRSDRTGR